MNNACGCVLPPAEPAMSQPSAACPTNQQVGQTVDLVTLKAGLALPLSWLTAEHYRFCHDPQCPTVYYSPETGQMFDEAALRERVFQKHPDDDDILVCYCFRFTVGDLRAELRQTGQITAIAAITAGIQAGQCACDLRNPQGSCCLGNVRGAVKRLQAELRSRS